MKKVKKIAMTIFIGLFIFFPVLSYTNYSKASDTEINDEDEFERLIVELGNEYRPVTQVASGSLYGLGHEDDPTVDLIAPTKPKMFTQMAPGGTHFPNGEDEVSGDALEVASTAEKSGATVTIRMPDIYPTFPYEWDDWNDWENKVRKIVKDTLDSNANNIYGYEIWNEPDGTWDDDQAGSFHKAWEKTYNLIKEYDEETDIIGPSITHYSEEWLKEFLTYAKDTDTLPDVISWHELGNPEGNHIDDPAPWAIESHVDSYRALEEELDIDELLISINEYGVQSEQAVPGSMIQYIAPFERAGVDTANIAFWYRPGRLSNLLTDSMDPNGAWWFYKWYGDMSGDMVNTKPHSEESNGLDGVVSKDRDSEEIIGIFGGADGDNFISVKDLDTVSFLEENVHVKVEEAPWYGVDTPLEEPTILFEGEFNVENGELNIPVVDMDKSSGYKLIINSSSVDINRYEAEDYVNESHVLESSLEASNGKYIQADQAEFNVVVPEDGEYEIEFRYANGSNKPIKQKILVNNESTAEISYTQTDGWIGEASAETIRESVHLNEGTNSLKLMSENNDEIVELDYIQVDAERKDTFEQLLEAEHADVKNAVKGQSSYGSGGGFVGEINYDDSFVEFETEIPISGEYTIEIGYANGTESKSSHSLLINEEKEKEISYEATKGWMKDVPNFGTRQMKTENVQLNEGKNNIKFMKKYDYAELDYLKITKNINVDSLKSQVQEYSEKDWIKNKGIKNSLEAKLNNGNLKAFINQLNAQRGKHISENAADYMLRDAEYLLDK